MAIKKVKYSHYQKKHKMEGLNFIELKGDIAFYSDAKGNLFQQIGVDEPFKVKDGKMSYRLIAVKNGCAIKYNTNGVDGFCIFNKRGNLMEDNIWKFKEAERITKELK